MNKDRILALADTIEYEAIPTMIFDMATVIEDNGSCGTAGCIAGYALAMEMGVKEAMNFYDSYDVNIIQKAGSYLGIYDYDYYDIVAGQLFIPNTPIAGDWKIRMSDITKEHAVFVLRNLAETGKVDWKLAFERYPLKG